MAFTFFRGFVGVFAALLVVCISFSARAAERKPNVIIIVADDLGWNGVGYHHGFAKTPNIDRFVKEGVNLDRFYVCPMCSPTRAGIMTGRYPIRFGMGRAVVRPWAKYGLPPVERTIAEALAEAGYENRVAFGKWHLGHLDPKWHPLAQGFTEFTGCYNGAIDYFTHNRDGQPDWHHNYDDVDEPGYATDLIADLATAYVRQHAKDASPFFTYVAFTAPHEPLQAPQTYLDQYRELGERNKDKQAMAAMITDMDDGIGRLLKAVDETGISRDTLIWFLSDNGGIRSIPGNNLPLRAGKLTVYEGGVRTPAAVWWRGTIEGGRVIKTPVMNVDLLPTIGRVAGAPVKTPAGPLDGVDVFDVLTGKEPTPASRDIYFFTGQNGLEDEQLAITSADGWKLVVIGPDVRRGGFHTSKHRVELFHLADDPLEKKDLAAAEPDRVAALGAKLVAFRKSEPADALPAMNRKPAEFQPPVKWHNGPG